MAELIVDDWDLVVRLTLGEKIWGFHGDIRVRLPSIVSVAPDPKPWLGLRGWRMAGVSFTGIAVLGTRRHGDGYDFCVLHRDWLAVRVDLATGTFQPLRHQRARGRRPAGGGGEDRGRGGNHPLGAGQLAAGGRPGGQRPTSHKLPFLVHLVAILLASMNPALG